MQSSEPLLLISREPIRMAAVGKYRYWDMQSALGLFSLEIIPKLAQNRQKWAKIHVSRIHLPPKAHLVFLAGKKVLPNYEPSQNVACMSRCHKASISRPLSRERYSTCLKSVGYLLARVELA